MHPGGRGDGNSCLSASPSKGASGNAPGDVRLLLPWTHRENGCNGTEVTLQTANYPAGRNVPLESRQKKKPRSFPKQCAQGDAWVWWRRGEDKPGHRRHWDRTPRSPAVEAENHHLHSPASHLPQGIASCSKKSEG